MNRNERTLHIIRYACLLILVFLGMVSIIGTGGGGGGGGGGNSGLPVTNYLGMTFNLIPAGTFTMGSPADESCRLNDEPSHQVVLTKSFYMQTTEVTQGQWREVMGSNPSFFLNGGDNCPVEDVTWYDVQTFISTLNARGEGKYRLPIEAEWEYACRAGSSTAFANGDIQEYTEWNGCNIDVNLDAMGWYCHNSGKANLKTQPVAQKQPNDWGLYDMHGNVDEWCWDCYDTYATVNVVNPAGPINRGQDRVCRGGNFSSPPCYCRSASRDHYNPTLSSQLIGFRLVYLPSGVDTSHTVAYYRDFDEDGYGGSNAYFYDDWNGDGVADTYLGGEYIPKGYAVDSTDCDDFNATVHPGAVEVIGDGIDNDCDGKVDEN